MSDDITNNTRLVALRTLYYNKQKDNPKDYSKLVSFRFKKMSEMTRKRPNGRLNFASFICEDSPNGIGG